VKRKNNWFNPIQLTDQITIKIQCVMTKKSILFWVLGMVFCIQNSIAQEENKKLEITPYGFIKGEMIYATDGVYSWGNKANHYISSPQFASGTETSALGFTAQHTRFGLKGTIGEEVKAGGVIELDFYGGAFDANVKPRIRQAYASILKGGFEARVGQQWDIFSPLNANTNNTNGNMWFAGNKGFRRAQFLLSYKIDHDMIAPMIQLSAGEAAREETGLGKDNLSVSPMFQGRLAGKINKKYTVGLSFVNASFVEKKGTVESGTIFTDTLTSDLNVSTSGFCVDVTLPFHKYFNLHGEFNIGNNLNNANLFSAAGNYTWSIADDTKVVNVVDKSSTGFWINAQSNVRDWLQVVIGYGMDNNTTSKLTVWAIESNSTFYGDLIFPIKHGFSVALEFQNIKTVEVTKLENDNAITTDFTANIINLAAKVNF
jgi:hypothetical protein